MHHFPLLGSVFRASLHKQQEAEEMSVNTAVTTTRRVPSRVGIRVNSRLVPTFPTTSYSNVRAQTTLSQPKPKLLPKIENIEKQNIPETRKPPSLADKTSDSFTIDSDLSQIQSFLDSNPDLLSSISTATSLSSSSQSFGSPQRIGTAKSQTVAPNVFYLKCLPPTAPASSSNFIQLEEMLARLLQNDNPDDPIAQNASYETVFLEIIRQYFIECSEQGKLLDKCRLFFNSVSDYIPKLKGQFQKQLQNIKKEIEKNNEITKQLQDDIDPMEKKSSELKTLMADLKSEFQVLVNHVDTMNTNINATWKEIDTMKANNAKIDVKIAEKNKELIKKNEEMSMLDEVSSKCTKDTLAAADQLRELLKQQKDLETQLQEEKEHLSRKRQQTRDMKKQIDKYHQTIREYKEKVQKVAVATQVELNTKGKRSAIVEKARKMRLQNQNKESEGELTAILGLITNEKEEGEVPFPEEGISIDSYQTFGDLKQLILEYNDKFQLSKDEINKAESGDFCLDQNPPEDYLRLFASRLTAAAIDSAIRKTPLHQVETQTQVRVMQSSSKQSALHSSHPNGTKFTKMIGADYSQREPQSLPWIIKNLRIIYDEKYKADMKCIETRTPLQSLADFIIQFAHKHNKLDFLADQFCWDIYNTCMAYSSQNDEVKMFQDALLENIDVEQLCFMLICRDYIMKVGAVVAYKTDDMPEQITQFYLSQDQIETALHIWWKDRYNERFYPRIMNFAVARPALHLEAMKRYVSMSDILSVMVDEYLVDKLDRMNELLLNTRIAPRVNHDEFVARIKKLIPQATDADIDRFFRATVTKSGERKEISKEDFAQDFLENSLLFKHEEHVEIDLKTDELLETIQDQWDQRKEQLTLMVNYFEGYSLEHPDDLQLRTSVSDAQRYLMMMEHSLSIRNAQEACFNYFHLIFALDFLFNTKDYTPESGENGLVFLECCIKEDWLDSVFIGA